MKVNFPILKCSAFVIIYLFSGFIPIQSQELMFRQGELLVQLPRNASAGALISEASSLFPGEAFDALQIAKEPMNIWKLTFDHATVNQLSLLERIKYTEGVVAAQHNHIIKKRNIPNDPLYSNQWQFNNIGQSGGLVDADIDADLAWDITTGGVTAGGDTIVVCIIDDGVDSTHQDFGPNLWVNHLEIPGNGIDDDGNGYTDDYFGWNVFSESDAVRGRANHGTPVAGIVGAKGNNGIGVSGVNWDVKLMIINGGGDEAEALASYSYAYVMRKLYNETNGQKGAFIVATNSSWGTDNGKPEDAPLWCGFYDLMGEVGILSCGATTNRNADVDIVGDLPTACPSNFLIAVSNINQLGLKVESAGFGLKSIDLGAPGDNVFTAAQGNTYDDFGGTSSAAPHVTGVVGLAYSVMCEDVVSFYRNDPAGAALFIKTAILDGVKTEEAFQTYFLTGGGLNAFNTVNIIQEYCGTCPFPFNINIDSVHLDLAEISWDADESVSFFNLRYKAVDDENWDTLSEVTPPVLLGDLLGCTEYEVQVQSICDVDSTSAFSGSKLFLTLGCCDAPLPVSFINKTDAIPTGNLSVEWDENPDYQTYFLEYKPDDADDWTTIETTATNVILGPFQECQPVQIRLSALCLTEEITAFSDTITAVTFCENCTELDYCDQPDLDSSGEWIESIQIGEQIIETGNNGGNVDFTGIYNIRVPMNETFLFGVNKGFGTDIFLEHVEAWIDFNGDGIFEDDENIFTENGATDNDILTTLFLDNDFEEGFTKMRIGMVYADNVTQPCAEDSDAQFGEFEDYCVYLFEPQPCDAGITIDTVIALSTEATVFFSPLDTAFAYNVRFKKVEESDDDWNTISVLDTMGLMAPLDECSHYVVQVRAVCPIDTSGFEMATDTFMTTGVGCMVNTIDVIEQPLISLTSYPNPFTDHLNFRMECMVTDEIHIEVYDLSGSRVYMRKAFVHSGTSELTIPEAANWTSGMYFVRVSGEEVELTQKVIKAAL